MINRIILCLAIGAMVMHGCASKKAVTITKTPSSESDQTTTMKIDDTQRDVKQPEKPNMNQAEIKTTASGLQYQIIHSGAGVIPKKGDNVIVHYTGKFMDGSLFDSSRDRNEPFKFALGQGQVIPGWDEGFALLKVGDKAILTIPPHLAYGENGMGPIPANSTLIFDVELLEVKARVLPQVYNIDGKKKLETASGLTYYMIQEGKGEQAAAGKTVKVHYSGYLEDGSMFDSSVERGEPIEFPLGQGMVIPGWEEGIALLKVGSKARLVIPYQLGYGENGYPPVIPAKSKLIFDVELINVK